MFGKLTSPRLIILIPLVLALIFAVACGSTAVQQEPRVVEKEVIKEVVVEKEVIKEVEVAKEVIKEVEVQKVVEKVVVATPTPKPKPAKVYSWRMPTSLGATDPYVLGMT